MGNLADILFTSIKQQDPSFWESAIQAADSIAHNLDAAVLALDNGGNWESNIEAEYFV